MMSISNLWAYYTISTLVGTTASLIAEYFIRRSLMNRDQRLVHKVIKYVQKISVKVLTKCASIEVLCAVSDEVSNFNLTLQTEISRRANQIVHAATTRKGNEICQ